MKVLKFGGSSVGNATNIRRVANIIKEQNKNSGLIVVVSAFSGVTNMLIKIGEEAAKKNRSYESSLVQLEKQHIDTVNELLSIMGKNSCLSEIKKLFNELSDIYEGVYTLNELSPRVKDKMMSFGEILSSKIISAYLNDTEQYNEWIDSTSCIKTDSTFGFAVVDFSITDPLIKKRIQESKHKLFIAPGFISSNQEGFITTLGRGGGDYSAAIYAAALEVEYLEIWTDVSGMMTADPRWVNLAKPIAHISYREAMELSHFGAKVIFPPTIIPAMKKEIKIRIKNTFAPDDAGSLIEKKVNVVREKTVTGISSINEIVLLSLEGAGMIGIPGFSKKMFETLARENINVILITQSSSEHSICIAISKADATRAQKTIDSTFDYEIKAGIVDPVKIEPHLSIVALVGDNMQSHAGISGKMFGAFGRNGINVRAIAQGASERNISAVVAFDNVKKAVNVLHETFFESSYKQLNVFVIGAGNVGKKLLAQIQQQQAYLLDKLNIQLRVISIANSRKMLFQEEGINMLEWQPLLEASDRMDISQFVDNIITKNMRNSVFVDITANADIASIYGKLLAKNIAVVACNKIANSSAYADYMNLKLLAKEYNVPFLFETNVGAGLPVISTLNDLIKSGDKINKIEAVLSGTLNFVFNHYNAEKKFAEVVRLAQEEGYTEPDPRLDLKGTDVMRKIMILARESGASIEMENIENNIFLPLSSLEGSIDAFYEDIAKNETHFQTLYRNAKAKNCKLKFVAVYENNKASVGLKEIPVESDFYHLYGKDNIVLFYTERYPEQPLVVKGAGAGADVTASGIFADIIKVAR